MIALRNVLARGFMWLAHFFEARALRMERCTNCGQSPYHSASCMGEPREAA